MPTMTGYVTLAQEGRFRLTGEDGVARSFVLGHEAALEPQDLPVLAREQRRVRIHFRNADRLLAGIVSAIEIEEAPSHVDGAREGR
jgi:hypothetical protein